MIPWGAIISLAGQAASGIMSAVNNKKMKQNSDAEYARQQAHYDAEAAENPLSRSENQAAINQYDRSAQKQIETARNVAAITGATPEYGLAVQQAAANGRADLMSNIAANASTRADKMREKAEASRQAQYATEQARRNERNTTYANLASNAANAFGSIVDSYQTQGGVNESAKPIVEGNAAAAKEQNPVVQTAAAPTATEIGKGASDALKKTIPAAPNMHPKTGVQVTGAPTAARIASGADQKLKSAVAVSTALPKATPSQRGLKTVARKVYETIPPKPAEAMVTADGSIVENKYWRPKQPWEIGG